MSDSHKDQKKVTIWVDEKLHDSFTRLCNDIDESQASMIRSYLITITNIWEKYHKILGNE